MPGKDSMKKHIATSEKSHDDAKLLDFIAQIERRKNCNNVAESLCNEIGVSARNALRVLISTKHGRKKLAQALSIEVAHPLDTEDFRELGRNGTTSSLFPADVVAKAKAKAVAK